MEAGQIQCLDPQAHLPIAQIEIDIFEIEIIKRRREETELRRQIGPGGQDRAINKIERCSSLGDRNSATIFAQSRRIAGQAKANQQTLAEAIDALA